MKVEVWHNIMWSKYKAGVFSCLNKEFVKNAIDVRFFQIAETAGDRRGLSGVDRSVHNYPYELLFEGNYADIPLLKLMAKIFSLEIGSQADVVLIAGYERPEFWLQLLIVKLRFKKAAVFCDSTGYDRPQTPLKSLAKRIFFNSCSKVFCYGERAAAYVMAHGVPQHKIAYRCQAASLPDTYDGTAIPAMRAAARDSVGHVDRFVYVGRLSPEKEIGSLLEAFAQHLKHKPSAQLIIVGAGPLEAELKAQAQSLGIAAAVQFTGGKSGPALYDEYLNATAMVLPSHSEPWGLVVNEALAYGCPVVVSNRCGCVPELVIDDVSGYVFACQDVADLSEKLVQVSALDSEATTRACLQVISSYTPENAAIEIMDGVKSIL